MHFRHAYFLHEGIFHYLVVVYLRPEKSFMSVVKKKKNQKKQNTLKFYK